jgi:REP element-mobilizing transposase RayT
MKCDTALWHVFARGTRRLELFRDDEDYRQFLNLLAFAIRESGSLLIAYAVMSNHYHLVLEASSEVLSTAMHHLNRMYSRYHNRKYGLTGHVFDGPYQAYRQRTPLLSLWTIAYVFLNPVKAGLCRRPEEYRWSGYKSFIGSNGDVLKVSSAAFMQKIGIETRTAWDRFHACIRAEMRRPSRVAAGRPSMLDVHADQFSWLVEHAAETLPAFSAEERTTIAIYWGRQCGIAPRAMARSLGMTDTYEIRQSLKRFKARLAEQPVLASAAELP